MTDLSSREILSESQGDVSTHWGFEFGIDLYIFIKTIYDIYDSHRIIAT